MDFQVLGIGPLELVFFAVILLLLFGPNDLARMMRSAGRFINRLIRSENYQVIQQASRELRNLPRRIVQEAHLEELEATRQEVRDTAAAVRGAVAGPGPGSAPHPQAPPSAPAAPAAPTFPAWTQALPPEGQAKPDPAPAASGDPYRAWIRDLTADAAPPSAPAPDDRPRP